MDDSICVGSPGSPLPEAAAHWEYKVIRVSVGNLTFQKYGPDAFPFEATLNELGRDGWEAFHAQAFAENEALLLFLKRRC